MRKIKSPPRGVADSADAETPFPDLVNRQDMILESSRIGGDYVHISSLATGSFCPRLEWIARRHPLDAVEKVYGSQRIVWALGRAAEAHVRKQLLAALPGLAWGAWQCERCGYWATEKFAGSTIPEEACPKCRRDVWGYREATLGHSRFPVIGRPDFVSLLAPFSKRVRVLEIKSIKKASYEALEGPEQTHVLQVSSYAHMLEDRGFEVTEASVLYVAKDAVAGSPYRQFRVTPSPLALHFMQTASAAFEEFPAPRLAACSSPSGMVPSNCAGCHYCFSVYE